MLVSMFNVNLQALSFINPNIISFQFISKDTVPKSYDVDCYFPVQRGCKMTLYQVMGLNLWGITQELLLFLQLSSHDIF